MTRFSEAVGQELRYVARGLWKNPGFSSIAVLSVALGIAVVTTMFSVVNAVLLRTVPLPDAGRLVRLVQQHTGGDATIPEYQFIKERGRIFSAIAVYRGGGEKRLEARGSKTWVTSLTISTDFLRTLRMPPAVGREFTTEETSAGGPQAVIISDALWRSSFGADAGVLGQSVAVDDAAFTVVGVLLALTIAGLCIGIGGALFVSRYLTSLLFGVTPTDPLSFVTVSLVLLVVASAASYLPARRAAAIDPMAAIRSE